MLTCSQITHGRSPGATGAAHEESSAGLMNVGMHTRCYTLALLAHYPQAGPEARPAYLAQVQANLRQDAPVGAGQLSACL